MCKYVVSALLRSTLYKGGMEKERGRKCSNFSQKGKGIQNLPSVKEELSLINTILKLSYSPCVVCVFWPFRQFLSVSFVPCISCGFFRVFVESNQSNCKNPAIYLKPAVNSIPCCIKHSKLLVVLRYRGSTILGP